MELVIKDKSGKTRFKLQSNLFKGGKDGSQIEQLRKFLKEHKKLMIVLACIIVTGGIIGSIAGITISVNVNKFPILTDRNIANYDTVIAPHKGFRRDDGILNLKIPNEQKLSYLMDTDNDPIYGTQLYGRPYNVTLRDSDAKPMKSNNDLKEFTGALVYEFGIIDQKKVDAFNVGIEKDTLMAIESINTSEETAIEDRIDLRNIIFYRDLDEKDLKSFSKEDGFDESYMGLRGTTFHYRDYYGYRDKIVNGVPMHGIAVKDNGILREYFGIKALFGLVDLEGKAERPDDYEKLSCDEVTIYPKFQETYEEVLNVESIGFVEDKEYIWIETLDGKTYKIPTGEVNRKLSDKEIIMGYEVVQEGELATPNGPQKITIDGAGYNFYDSTNSSWTVTKNKVSDYPVEIDDDYCLVKGSVPDNYYDETGYRDPKFSRSGEKVDFTFVSSGFNKSGEVTTYYTGIGEGLISLMTIFVEEGNKTLGWFVPKDALVIRGNNLDLENGYLPRSK